MDFPGLLAQLLNGVQYGLLLFLISSGLTLIFGVMGIINLAHGSLFMIGAYVAYLVARQWGIGVAGAAGGHRRRHPARACCWSAACSATSTRATTSTRCC